MIKFFRLFSVGHLGPQEFLFRKFNCILYPIVEIHNRSFNNKGFASVFLIISPLGVCECLVNFKELLCPELLLISNSTIRSDIQPMYTHRNTHTHPCIITDVSQDVTRGTFADHNHFTCIKAQPWTPEPLILCFLWDLSLLYRFTMNLIKC